LRPAQRTNATESGPRTASAAERLRMKISLLEWIALVEFGQEYLYGA